LPPRAPSPPGDDSPTEIMHPVGVDDYAQGYDEEYPEDYLEDDYPEEDYPEDERAEPEYIEPPDGPEAPAGGRGRGRPRRNPLRWAAALAVIVLIGGAAWFGIDKIFGYADYQGDGGESVLVQIGEGDSTNAIGTALANAGVVASAKAFVKASEDNSKVLTLQPGYYVLKAKMSGAAAVSMLTGSAARVGVLQVRAGTQLDDVNQPGGEVTPGVFTLLAKASCANLNGKSTCVSTDDLRKTAQSADLAAMGVPDWAAAAASKSTDARRIEGLVAPGVYDVKPGWNAEQLLSYVLKSSAEKMQAASLVSDSNVEGHDAYQILIIASLIEREGVKQDFGKISRVIYNRLATPNMRLQLDSTVNYLLDRPVITTTDADRSKPGPYNTYSTAGLPPTPISSPSPEAIEAALQPTAGNWLYFVKCEKNGLSCFAATPAEHDHNKEIAKQNGAY
jgi:peptidoglycan lytic transglycosylase G